MVGEEVFDLGSKILSVLLQYTNSGLEVTLKFDHENVSKYNETTRLPIVTAESSLPCYVEKEVNGRRLKLTSPVVEGHSSLAATPPCLHCSFKCRKASRHVGLQGRGAKYIFVELAYTCLVSAP